MLGPAARATIAQDAKNMLITPPTEQDMAMSKAVEAQTNQSGINAVAQGHTLNQLASELTKLPDSGALSGGPLNDMKLALASKANDVMRTLGYPGEQILPQDIATAKAADKLSTMLQFAATHNADQNSQGALQTAQAIIPSTALDKKSAAEVLSGLYIDKQGAIDRQTYLQQYRGALAAQNPALQNNYRAQNALQAFNQDHNDAQYGREKEKLAQFLAAKGTFRGESPVNALYHGNLKPEVVDRNMGPGFSRYFLNQ